MIRKLILSTVIATGAVTGLALTPSTADAAPPIGHDHHPARLEVLVRHRLHWDVYGTYRDRDDARRVARMLKRQGHEVRIEVERGRW
jgi:hypothetical protein